MTALRPKDAATLIIVRDGREVLMGRRHRRHAFMPERYVFPGGAVDRADSHLQPASALRPEVLEQLTAGCSAPRARAIAMAGVRETFEETGLLLGLPTDRRPNSRSAAWRAFFDHGLAPHLATLSYAARAITPVRRPRRFDARFFIVDACFMHGALVSNGELEDLRWWPIAEAQKLEMARITAHMLASLPQILSHPPRGPVPLFRTRKHNRTVV